MRFDYASFCIGLLAGFVGFLCIFYLADIYGVQSALLCKPGEGSITCVREWADVLAIAGAAATVIFILFQMRGSEEQHQANMALQTLPMRASLARFVVEVIEPLETMLIPIVDAEMKFAAGRWSKINPATTHDKLNQIAMWLGPESLRGIVKYDDGTLIELRDQAETAAASARQLWTRVHEGNHIPLVAATPEACASLKPAITACHAFANAARGLHELVTGGTAPSVRTWRRKV